MLQQISVYLLKVICISGLLFLYYHIALRNKQFHYYNRFYLLMAIAISTVLPLLQLEWFTFFSGSQKTIHLYKIIYGKGENDVTGSDSAAVNWEQLCLYAFAIISFCLLIFLCSRIIKIQRLKKKFPIQQFSDFDFINTDISSAPFSFLKNIFWRNDINLHEEIGKQILQHEITHIQQKHSWDKLFMQSVMCFYWMNPFFYLIKKELYLIHEFIADEKAIKHADADAFAKMLLTAQFGKFNFLPAQSIFYSSIKRRLVMLTTSKKSQFSYVRRLMVLPLLATLVCLFAFTVKTRNTGNHSIQNIKAVKHFVLVVDAGHGGKDNGSSANGLYEKDITLKIAEKIKSMSSQYNIDVILTRNNDEFMSPQEKSNFANAQNADAFISVHVNADESQPALSGFEVALSKNNTKFLTNNQTLGSAILQNINSGFKTQQALQLRNVGIWVLDQSKIPSALIECGYLTNTNDANTLKNDAKLELIAQHILQGVAAYANNSFDKSKLLQIETTFSRDTLKPPVIVEDGNGNKPMYVLNGKTISESEMKAINPNNIESINVWKDKEATDKYGDKGKNGVVEITLKKGIPPPPPPPPLPTVLRDTLRTTN